MPSPPLQVRRRHMAIGRLIFTPPCQRIGLQLRLSCSRYIITISRETPFSRLFTVLIERYWLSLYIALLWKLMLSSSSQFIVKYNFLMQFIYFHWGFRCFISTHIFISLSSWASWPPYKARYFGQYLTCRSRYAQVASSPRHYALILIRFHRA